MTVRKYRSVEEMPAAAVRTPLDPANLRLACDLSAAARQLGGRRFPPGVYRHRSVDAGRQLRESWERGGAMNRVDR